MIPVQHAAEPPGFDKDVRQPGLDAVRERVGEARHVKRTGPPLKKTWADRASLPSGELPDLWTLALEDLRKANNSICAYLGLRVDEVTGAPTVDHFIPVKGNPDGAYDWANFRFACGSANRAKGTKVGHIDPFHVQPGWFELNEANLEVQIGSMVADPALRLRIDDAIRAYGLNNPTLVQRRTQYVQDHIAPAGGNPIMPIHFIERDAPFVAQELKRWGAVRQP